VSIPRQIQTDFTRLAYDFKELLKLQPVDINVLTPSPKKQFAK
jgi:hypothetical protein